MSDPLLNSLNIPFDTHAPLSEFTTFRLGGICPVLFHCQTPDDLEKAVKTLLFKNLPFILIGGGSNLVISDEGLDCYVIRYLSKTPIIRRDGFEIIVSGSTILDDLAKFAAEEGLEGLNYTSGIPGTVGGAVVGNAGAFGKQVGDVLKDVVLINLKTGEKVQMSKDKLGFRYRDSDLKKTGDIVLEARFQLSEGNREALLNEREETLSIRREKHPNLEIEPCAGSFFRNIEPTSQAGKRQATGWFLEQAGGKKLKCGGAVIYSKHANIIIKSNDCTAQDVHDLSKLMAQLAKESFQLDLVREVRFVGKFKGMPPNTTDITW